jgi:hypothetical protein
VLLAALAVSAPARDAYAQQRSAVDIAQARDLFNQAMDLREKGNAPDALDKFKAANALAGTPITGLELGRTYAALGKLVEAREAFLAVARVPAQAGETTRSKAARKESADLAEQIRPRLPSLAVRVLDVPLDTVAVTIDGAAVPSDALSAPRSVNPGSHKIVATTTAGGNADATVDLKEGEARTVDLKIVLTSAPPPAAPSTPPASLPETVPATTGASSGLGPLVYAGFGVAVAGVAAGSVTGLMSLSKASSVKSACDGTTCPKSIDGDLQSGRTLGNVSTIAFAVAGAGAVVGIIGLLVRPHGEKAPEASAWIAPWVGPGSAGVGGAF